MEEVKIGDRVTTGNGIQGVVKSAGLFATVMVDYDNGVIKPELRVYEKIDLQKIEIVKKKKFEVDEIVKKKECDFPYQHALRYRILKMLTKTCWVSEISNPEHVYKNIPYSTLTKL